jgi:hypothetical protein
MGVLVSRRHTDNHLFRQKIKKLYIFFCFFLFYRGLQAVLEQNLLMKAVNMSIWQLASVGVHF